MSIKYSIVIPTWNKYVELLHPCIESIKKNTSSSRLEEIEFVIVANGCTDSTETLVKAEFLGLNIKVVSFPDPIGYTRATNIGIKESSGEYIVLMNNDCVILDFLEKDEWLDLLEGPFKDPNVAITGVKKIYSQQAKSSFLIFFLVMIKRSVFNVVGYLDESLSENGSGAEDIDFFLRLKKHGLRGVKVPNDDENYDYATEYPVYHAGEKSVFDVPDWENKFWERMSVLEKRVDSFYYEGFADVTAYVSTKGRYTTTLAACLISIANQTLKPKHIIIFQDDHQEYNMQESTLYRNILYGLFPQKGIEWQVVFGAGKGQVLNHQKAIEISKTPWLWRVDDDNVAEPNVLEGLCKHIDKTVGAIASAVIDPSYVQSHTHTALKIKDINIAPNHQWIKSNRVVKSEHLYSTFLFRKEAAKHGYNKELSPVGSREETIFTYEMHRNGWDLIIDTNLVTWHFRESVGGIRSYSDKMLWDKDEVVFKNKLNEWGIVLSENLLVNFDNGRGDHWALKKSLEKLLIKRDKDIVVCAACYPDVIKDLEYYSNLKIVSISEGTAIFGKELMDHMNIYRYCDAMHWTDQIAKAFEKMYDIE